MRRALPALVVLALAVAVVLAVSACGSTSSSYTVDAVFDTAKGLVPGQTVDIAGARVGTITAVRLKSTADHGYQAVLELSIEKRFAPFHANASCRILPEGLISENYVECNPGTATGGPLARSSTGVPTVGVGQTSTPASLQDMLDTFNLPTDQRIRFILNTLGVGTAGRGTDINAILRRANPALVQARRVLSILDAQNQRIAAAVDQTDSVIGELARQKAGVRQFVDRAASVSRTTAAHRTALGAGIHELPAMLGALRGGLRSVDTATGQAVPLLHDLRASAPGLNALTRQLPVFTTAAVPALRSLGGAARQGLRTVGPAGPVVSALRRFASRAAPIVPVLDQLLVSLRDSGAIEGFLRVPYNYGSYCGYEDSLSHFCAAIVNTFPDCVVANSNGQQRPGCRHTFSSPKYGQAPINEPNVDPGPNTPADNFAPNHGPTPTRRARPPSTAQVRRLLAYLLR